VFFDSRPKVNVHIIQSDETYACALDESLLTGMMRLGRKGIPVGCVNGGCGVCKVRVTVGAVKSLGPISRAHVTEEEEAQGFTLACRSAPVEAVCLVVAGKMAKKFSKTSAD
jgi:ferredoxin